MGDLMRLYRWGQRVCRKYFKNREDYVAGIAALEQVVARVDLLVPDSIDRKVMERAKDVIGKLKEAADKIPFEEG